MVLTDRDYYYSIKDDIRNAKKTILVAMYIMKYDPDDTSDWANDLIEELVDAKNHWYTAYKAVKRQKENDSVPAVQTSDRFKETAVKICPGKRSRRFKSLILQIVL